MPSPAVGTPRVGVHRVRIPLLDVALFDTVATAVLGVLLARAAHWRAPWVLLTLFLISLPVHWMVGVETQLVRRLLRPTL
jgi:hypothetical protein